jgi:hypothetical protein
MEETYPQPCCDMRGTDQFHDSMWLISTMVSLLQQHFGSDDRMTLGLSTFKWSRDANVTKIVIDNVDNTDFGTGDIQPRILVDLENQGFPRDTIGDRNDYLAELGQENFTIRIESAFSIETWSNKKLEAWALADEVRLFIQTYRTFIAHQHCFNFLRPSQIIKPVKSKMYEDYWIARTIIAFDLSDSWGVRREDLKAGPIDLTLNPL